MNRLKKTIPYRNQLMKTHMHTAMNLLVQIGVVSQVGSKSLLLQQQFPTEYKTVCVISKNNLSLFNTIMNTYYFQSPFNS